MADTDELTPEQREYNVAEAELFQLAAYGHHQHWPAGVTHPREYIDLLHGAQQRFADAVQNRALIDAADVLERIADETEAKVAAHYGPASGIGPGSADMVREAARTVRSLAARNGAR